MVPPPNQGCNKAETRAERLEAGHFAECLRALKADPRKDRDGGTIAEAEAHFKALTKEARALQGKADDIGNQFYDLKVANPHKKPEIETRTPEDLLDAIEANGGEIEEALADALTQYPDIDALRPGVVTVELPGEIAAEHIRARGKRLYQIDHHLSSFGGRAASSSSLEQFAALVGHTSRQKEQEIAIANRGFFPGLSQARVPWGCALELRREGLPLRYATALLKEAHWTPFVPSVVATGQAVTATCSSVSRFVTAKSTTPRFSQQSDLRSQDIQCASPLPFYLTRRRISRSSRM